MEINELLVYLRNFTFGQFGSEKLTLFVDIIFVSVLALETVENYFGSRYDAIETKIGEDAVRGHYRRPRCVI